MLSKDINDYERSTAQYFVDISKIKNLSKTEERELLREYKTTGSQIARDKILNANLKFVVSIAKGYKGRGLPFADLIAEGNMGMMKALEKFNMSNEVKFISYAVWWIRQAMCEAIEKRNGLMAENLPDETADIVKKEDVSEDEDVSHNQYIDAYGHYDKEKAESIASTINILTQDLSERELDILTKYEGLNGNKQMTLEEIGMIYGLTKERVRQINEKSIKKMCARALIENVTSDVYR